MGIVYLAEHVRLKKRMALKVLPPELCGDREFRRRFERESQTAAALDHPNIVPVHDAGEVDGLLYIAMRYVEGTDLGKLLAAEGALEPERALSILGQTADALDEAHAEGLVHRDVKPANILLARSRKGERVFLSDFGLAKQWASGSSLTRSGFFVGTISYAAPEQFTGGDIDGRADVYSLGCVMFECLTGRPPFERPHEPAVMYAHLQDAPPPVSGARPGLPEVLDQVVATAMAKDRADRYPTSGELIGAARAAFTGIPAGPKLAPTRRTPATAAASTEPAAAPGAPTTPRAQAPPRRRIGWIAAAVVAAAGLAVGGFLLLRGSEGPGVTVTGDGTDQPAPPDVPSTTPPTDPPTTPPIGPPVTLTIAEATASSTAPPGMDACGTPVPFDADLLIDGDSTTAWRTTGDGIGESVVVRFDGRVRVARVGLIPGYSKVDPCDGTDRFQENRIIRRVRYLFDDGSTAVQRFRPVPELQFVEVDAVTESIVVRVVETTGHGGRDYAVISEIGAQGYLAA